MYHLCVHFFGAKIIIFGLHMVLSHKYWGWSRIWGSVTSFLLQLFCNFPESEAPLWQEIVSPPPLPYYSTNHPIPCTCPNTASHQEKNTKKWTFCTLLINLFQAIAWKHISSKMQTSWFVYTFSIARFHPVWNQIKAKHVPVLHTLLYGTMRYGSLISQEISKMPWMSQARVSNEEESVLIEHHRLMRH